MLGAELRDFQSPVAGIHHFLPDSFHFVAEHESGLFPGLDGEILQGRAVFHLFHGIDLVALGFEFGHGLQRILVVLPIHAQGRAQGGFFDFPVRRHGGNAAKAEFFHAEGIAGPEAGTYVMHAPHIVQDYAERVFVGFLELGCAHPSQFLHGFESMLSHRCCFFCGLQGNRLESGKFF